MRGRGEERERSRGGGVIKKQSDCKVSYGVNMYKYMYMYMHGNKGKATVYDHDLPVIPNFLCRWGDSIHESVRRKKCRFTRVLRVTTCVRTCTYQQKNGRL